MDNSPIISVIVPVYNTEESRLRRCLRPFIEHDDKRIELIVVDDGSEESSRRTVEALLSSVQVPHRVMWQNNRGQNAARNAGISQASGRYICFLDSDDCIDWAEFLTVLKYAECHCVDCITFNAKELSPDGAVVGERDFSALLGESNDEIKRNLLRRCQELWMHVLSRDLLTNSDGLYDDAAIGEDVVSLFSLISKADTFAVLDCAPYQYQLGGGISSTASVAQRLTIIDAFNWLLKVLGGERARAYYDELEWQAIYHVRYIQAGGVIKTGLTSSSSDVESASSMQRWVDRTFPNWRNNRYLTCDPRAGSLSFKLISNGHLRLFALLYRLKMMLQGSRFV